MTQEELLRLTYGQTRIAATDGAAIYYAREWLDKAALGEVKFVIAHETLHCLLEHWYRKGQRANQRWAYACDYSINGILSDDKGLMMPHAALFSGQWKRKSTEEIYALLKENTQGGGRGGTESGDAGNKNVNDWNIGGVIDLRDENNPNIRAGEAQSTKISNEWKIEVQKAFEQAKKAGVLPAGLERMVADMRNPDRELEDVLREFVVKTLEGDYTMFPCSKLFIPYGVYLPTTRGEKAPFMIQVCDTSGSVNENQIGIYEAKINNVLYELNAEVMVIYSDTDVYPGETYTKNDLPVKLKPKGNGGTSFVKVFDYIERNNLDPACLIYLTDLYCNDYPKSPPSYPVLWGWVCKDNQRKGNRAWADSVPFGQVVNVREEN